jgi:1-acyl-sn-glycerol-3-phosphate acyltransferase
MQKPIAARSEALGGARRGRAGSIPARFSRIWRMALTGFSFALFGILSLLVALTVMPLLRALPGTPREREVRTQRAVHWLARAFLGSVSTFQLGRFESTNGERLRQPGQLIVANHPTLLDAILLISLMPQADCVIKGSHMDDVFMGRAARGAGYIPNWEGPGLVDDCVERLIQGRSVIIFPEGTRSPVDELGRFARGAAHIALRSGRDPIPVTIRCDPATLYRGKAWWDVPHRRFTLSARVGDPLIVKDLADPTMSPALAARAVTRGLRARFEQELGNTETS